MAEEKKLIIDEDWKSQVEREKEALTQARAGEVPAGGAMPGNPSAGGATARGAAGAGTGAAAQARPQDAQRGPEDDPPLPPASFSLLVTTLATQALWAMGLGGEGLGAWRPQAAQHFIDSLGVLEEKTRGNLTPAEAAHLGRLLHELRMTFVAGPPDAGEAQESTGP